MQGYDVYRCYLAFKLHFSNKDYDFFKYEGKANAKEETYQQRSDFYFFETLARKLTAQEVKEYMLACFVSADDPSKVWIGDIKREGQSRWIEWQKLHSSLTYLFKSDLKRVDGYLEQNGVAFNDLFSTEKGHAPLLKLLLKQEIKLESLIIMDMVLGFTRKWDTAFRDPLWESISFKIKKYKPFLSIPTNKYKGLLRETFGGSRRQTVKG